MATWRSIDVWPCSGFADKPWQDNPDDDAFVRSAQRIWRTYEQALPGLELPIRASHLRVALDFDPGRRIDDPHAPATVTITELESDASWRNHALVRLPPGVASLSSTARGLLALDVLHTAGLRLAVLAGWEPDRLTAARQHVLDQNLEFVWTAPWKSSPDRKHRARMGYRLDDDGLGRMRIEVTDGDMIRSTPWGQCVPNFKHAAKQLKWDGTDAVSFHSYDDGFLGHPERAALSALLPVDDASSAIDAETPRPPVLAWIPAPRLADRVSFVGGGAMNVLPMEFSHTVWRLFRALEAPEWQAWWAPAQLGTLELLMEFGEYVKPPVIYVRKTKGKVDARVRVPELPPGVDPATHAYDLTIELLAKVRQSTGLGPHPELRALQADHAAIAQEQAEDERRERSVRDLMSAWGSVDGTVEDPARG